MKIYLLVLILQLVLTFTSFAQKHDYIWVLGNDGGTTIDFNTAPPTILFANRNTEMYVTNASISDENGNLLFYTNGCDIFDRENNIMENGQGINPGQLHNDNCVEPFNAYTVMRGALILPKPNSDSLYYLFHQGGKIVFEPNIDGFIDKQYYTIIDMSINGGLGKVVEKNLLILNDTFYAGDFTAVKHQNNLDWWILSTKRASNLYFKTRFTSAGVESVETQVIGDSTKYDGDGGGQALFSPDGQLFVRYNFADGIMIFDFDRASGELSNYRQIDNGDTVMVAGGVAISSNSRYLYISSQLKFYQYDLQASDIAASRIMIGEYDGYASPFFATTFFNCQLAPDCKIYCNTFNSCDVLHVVNNPDEPGLACDFVQHGVQLPSVNSFSLPNFPNYRLGTGQPPCVPSASGEVEQEQHDVKVYPNPASQQVTVSLPAPLPVNATWSLHDALGREVSRTVLSAGQQEAAVGLVGLVPGLYFWQVTAEGMAFGSGKLIVIK